MSPILAEVPELLKSMPNWVHWKLVPNEDGEIGKVPFIVGTQKYASSTRSSTWATFEEATRNASLSSTEGVGFVIHGDAVKANLVGFDLDGCRNPRTGELTPWAEKIIGLLDSYTEITPSKTGVRVWVIGKLPGTDHVFHLDPAAGVGEKVQIEIFDRARYFTMTGQSLYEGEGASDIQSRDLTEVYQLCQDFRAKYPAKAKSEPVLDDSGASDIEGAKIHKTGTVITDKLELLMRGEIVSRKPFSVSDGMGNSLDYPSHSEADLALCTALALKHGNQPDLIYSEYEQSSLYREKWSNRSHYFRDNTIAKAIKTADRIKSQQTQAKVSGQVLNATPSQDDVEIETFANDEMELQEWLWDRHIPVGALTLFAGNPDTGKTTAALDLIARVTKGLDFPDASANDFPPSDVILCEAEDDAKKTLGPRLSVAADDIGADLNRVIRVRVKLNGTQRTRMLQLDRDLDVIERTIRARPECRLMVISPISAYLGPSIRAIDDSGIRAVLGPLQDMASRLNIAVVAIIHLNKSSDYDVIYRISGAMGFVAVARASWIFAKDAKDKISDKRYMMPIKGNLAAKQKGIVYHIRQSEKPVQVKDHRKNQMVETFHPRIFWGETTDVDANDVMRESVGFKKSDELPEATIWLASLFNDPETGKHMVNKLVKLAEYRKALRSVSFPARTIKRAQLKLGVSYDLHRQSYVMEPPEPPDAIL